MPDSYYDWMTRIKAVERECLAIQSVMERLFRELTKDSTQLSSTVNFRDVKQAYSRLENTYIIRLFSEYEAALIQLCRDLRIRMPQNAKTLINRITSRGKISPSVADNVHLVRDYRNFLVHQTTAEPQPVSIHLATRHLCTFISWLQRQW